MSPTALDVRPVAETDEDMFDLDLRLVHTAAADPAYLSGSCPCTDTCATCHTQCGQNGCPTYLCTATSCGSPPPC